MRPKVSESLIALPIDTQYGIFIAHYSENGLAQLDFPSNRPFALAPGSSWKIRQWHKLTTNALRKALANKPVKKLPPLDLTGSNFQKRVWDALQRIKRGRTISYSQLADEINKAKAARAVGSACGANPIPVLIPCHRVVACNGKLCGFSGGMNWKWRLLFIEQASIKGTKLLPKFSVNGGRKASS